MKGKNIVSKYCCYYCCHCIKSEVSGECFCKLKEHLTRYNYTCDDFTD